MAFLPVQRPFLGSHPQIDTPHVTFLGAPLDRTQSFRFGAAGGPAAIRHFSESIETYSPAQDRDLAALRLLDRGDLDLAGLDLAAALHAIEEATESLPGFPVILGGEHTISLATVRAMRRRYPDLRVLQLDAHLDLITEYAGQAISHASVFRRVCEEIGPGRLAQLGVRSGTPEEWQFARANLLYSSPDLALPPTALAELRRGPVFLSIDIDVLDPACAPGTGCPEPGGPTFREMERFLWTLRELPIVGMDLVEVLPEVDPAGIAAVSAAKILRETLLHVVAPRVDPPDRDAAHGPPTRERG